MSGNAIDKPVILEEHSRLEPVLREWVAKPILGLIPESVSPNALSLVGVLIAVAGFVLAAVAPDMDPQSALWARIGAGVCVWLFMITDCLDGMQARRTNRCSRFGEFVDHWLDALSMPLAASGLILTLELDPYTTAAAVVTTVMVYNAQLVIHHHTGRFIHPPTSGVDAQFLVGIALVLFGVLLSIVPRDHQVLGIGVTVFAWGAIAGSMRNCLFYYERMGSGLLRHHLKMVLLGVALSVPYCLGMMSATAFCVLITFLSFRVCGSYVMMTLVGQRYSGLDWALAAWAGVIVALNLALGRVEISGALTLQEVLPYLACLHALALNLVELARALPALREEQPEQAATTGPAIG